jgi:trigger factor
VRLGLILSQLVQDNNLQATQEQVKAQIEDFAQSYEDPKEVLKYYYSDRRRLG